MEQPEHLSLSTNRSPPLSSELSPRVLTKGHVSSLPHHTPYHSLSAPHSGQLFSDWNARFFFEQNMMYFEMQWVQYDDPRLFHGLPIPLIIWDRLLNDSEMEQWATYFVEDDKQTIGEVSRITHALGKQGARVLSDSAAKHIFYIDTSSIAQSRLKQFTEFLKQKFQSPVAESSASVKVLDEQEHEQEPESPKSPKQNAEPKEATEPAKLPDSLQTVLMSLIGEEDMLSVMNYIRLQLGLKRKKQAGVGRASFTYKTEQDIDYTDFKHMDEKFGALPICLRMFLIRMVVEQFNKDRKLQQGKGFKVVTVGEAKRDRVVPTPKDFENVGKEEREFTEIHQEGGQHRRADLRTRQGAIRIFVQRVFSPVFQIPNVPVPPPPPGVINIPGGIAGLGAQQQQAKNLLKDFKEFNDQLDNLYDYMRDYKATKEKFLAQIAGAAAFMTRALLVKPENDIRRLEAKIGASATSTTHALMTILEREAPVQPSHLPGAIKGALQGQYAPPHHPGPPPPPPLPGASFREKAQYKIALAKHKAAVAAYRASSAIEPAFQGVTPHFTTVGQSAIRQIAPAVKTKHNALPPGPIGDDGTPPAVIVPTGPTGAPAVTPAVVTPTVPVPNIPGGGYRLMSWNTLSPWTMDANATQGGNLWNQYLAMSGKKPSNQQWNLNRLAAIGHFIKTANVTFGGLQETRGLKQKSGGAISAPQAVQARAEYMIDTGLGVGYYSSNTARVAEASQTKATINGALGLGGVGNVTHDHLFHANGYIQNANIANLVVERKNMPGVLNLDPTQTDYNGYQFAGGHSATTARVYLHYVSFKNAGGNPQFYVYNIHLSKGRTQNIGSDFLGGIIGFMIQDILERNHPVFLCGDLNTNADVLINNILDDATRARVDLTCTGSVANYPAQFFQNASGNPADMIFTAFNTNAAPNAGFAANNPTFPGLQIYGSGGKIDPNNVAAYKPAGPVDTDYVIALAPADQIRHIPFKYLKQALQNKYGFDKPTTKAAGTPDVYTTAANVNFEVEPGTKVMSDHNPVLIDWLPGQTISKVFAGGAPNQEPELVLGSQRPKERNTANVTRKPNKDLMKLGEMLLVDYNKNQVKYKKPRKKPKVNRKQKRTRK